MENQYVSPKEEKKNFEALYHILSALDKLIFLLVTTMVTANEAWKALEDSYGESNGYIKSVRLQNVKRAFENLKMVEEEESGKFLYESQRCC